jgi:hypothetical protein
VPEPQIPPWVADKLRAAGIPLSVIPRLASVRPNFFGKITLRAGNQRAIVHYEHGGITRIETVAAERLDGGVEMETSESTIPMARGIRFEKRG